MEKNQSFKQDARKNDRTAVSGKTVYDNNKEDKLIQILEELVIALKNGNNPFNNNKVLKIAEEGNAYTRKTKSYNEFTRRVDETFGKRENAWIVSFNDKVLEGAVPMVVYQEGMYGKMKLMSFGFHYTVKSLITYLTSEGYDLGVQLDNKRNLVELLKANDGVYVPCKEKGKSRIVVMFPSSEEVNAFLKSKYAKEKGISIMYKN